MLPELVSIFFRHREYRPLARQYGPIDSILRAGINLDMFLPIVMISLLRLIPTTGKREAVLDILTSAEQMTRVKTGCINCAIYEGRTNAREILYIEQWRTKKDLHRHIQSDLYFRILAAMELAIKAPELRFHDVSEAIGLELIRRLRTQEPKG